MSNPYFPNLLSPIQIGSKTYKNRIIRSPKGPVMIMPDGNVLPIQLTDAAVRCDGGVAEFCIGETAVSRAAARGDEAFFGFEDFSEEHTKPYRDYCNVIHEHGAAAMIELCHTGMAKPEPSEDNPAFGPSDFIREDGAQVHGMTKDEIAQTVQDFATAAWFMKKTGFDGVCLHAGHGWLPHQFLSLRWNKRNDEYGGSIENRSRISAEILKAIREKCGSDFVIEVRLSGQENVPDGYDLETITAYAKQIEPYVDMIHVSAGIYNKPMETKMMSTLYDLHGCNVEAAAAIKKVVGVPVAVVGGINNPSDAEAWIREGKCDLVAMCRALDADLDWIRKAQTGRASSIRKCIRCMRCFPGPHEEAMKELNGKFPEGCSINPYSQHGDKKNAGPAEVSKNVLVVGGGVGGMQTAITASERGHHVTLLEKTGELGGILNFAKDDNDKYDLKGLVDSMAAEIRDRDIRVVYNTEASEEWMKGRDAVVLAVGSSPLVPPIPGLEHALAALNSYRPDAPIGENVVMLGGGLVGCETAVHLSKHGRRVTIVEMRSELAPDAYRLHKHKLRQLIAEDDNITVMTDTKCLEVKEDGVSVSKADGTQAFLAADTVISALGMKANDTSDLEKMAESAGVPCIKIGDCVHAGKIYDAIEQGFETGFSF